MKEETLCRIAVKVSPEGVRAIKDKHLVKKTGKNYINPKNYPTEEGFSRLWKRIPVGDVGKVLEVQYGDWVNREIYYLEKDEEAAKKSIREAIDLEVDKLAADAALVRKHWNSRKK